MYRCLLKSAERGTLLLLRLKPFCAGVADRAKYAYLTGLNLLDLIRIRHRQHAALAASGDIFSLAEWAAATHARSDEDRPGREKCGGGTGGGNWTVEQCRRLSSTATRRGQGRAGSERFPP